MITSLILPWFPIVLVAGLGGRLLEHRRGHWLGIVCALFWIMLVQASVTSSTGYNASALVALLSGAAVIVAIGIWSSNNNESGALGRSSQRAAERMIYHKPEESSVWPLLGEELYRFDDWLEHHRERSDIWSEFDEYVRSALARLCHSTHVRPYRTTDHATGMATLRASNVWNDVPQVSSTLGVLTHVMQSKCRYVKTISVDLYTTVNDSDSRTQEPAWCFPVLRSQECIGVIEVGTIGISQTQRDAVLTCVERLIGLFWNAVYDCAIGAHLGRTDPVSGLLTREAFLQSAQCALRQSYKHNEPVAMVIIALERLRHLSDSGRWESVDEIVRAAGDVVRNKIRADDCLGRFDESRIVVLLRRIDAELATLVATQLVTRLEQVVGDSPRWGGEVGVRCGVVSTGSQTPDIRGLLSSALSTWRTARTDSVSMVSRMLGVEHTVELTT